MNKSKVVFHLVSVIQQRFRGATQTEIEATLVREGWAIGAVREAIAAR